MIVKTRNSYEFVERHLVAFAHPDCSAVPIAILTNAAGQRHRVLAHYYGTRVADGFFHEFSGWVIYIAAALLCLRRHGYSIESFLR